MPFVAARAAVLIALLVACSPAETSTVPQKSEGSSTAPLTPTAEAPISEPAPGDDNGGGADADDAEVTRVIDGDTIEVLYQGEALDVRLIGIDTPETVHPSEPVECYGRAASRFTSERLDGNIVRLEFDVERLDRYGRTLAYIWLGGELFNETITQEGFASVSTYPPNVKYVDRFLRAQREARRHDRGLWGACAPMSTPPTIPPPPGGGNCDASYPGVCIPPPPPDLNCDDVPYTNLTVVGTDPHGFDGNDDGVGCEG